MSHGRDSGRRAAARNVQSAALPISCLSDVSLSRDCLIPRQCRTRKSRFTAIPVGSASASLLLGRMPMQKFFYPAAVLVVAVFVTPALAQTAATPPKTPAPQTAPPPQAPPTQAPPRAAAPRPRAATPAATQVIVRNNSGTGLEGVRIAVSGTSGQQTTTDAKGAASVTLPAGNYRLRFEHEDFITLERDVTIRAGQNPEIVVALDVAPPPPEPPAPAPPPPPERSQAAWPADRPRTCRFRSSSKKTTSDGIR